MTRPVDITAVSVHDPSASAILRTYFADVAGRYYGRPATPAELDTAMAEDPSDDLVPPHGVFLLARDHDEVVGCVGVRLSEPVSEPTAELKRLFVRPECRGRGIGTGLLAAAEAAARDLGAAVMRLDTRHDLVEAHRLYDGHGYRRIPGYNNAPYAEVWFAKNLD